jgi:hypothetical protein
VSLSTTAGRRISIPRIGQIFPLTANIHDFPKEETLHLDDIEVALPENGDPVCFKQIRQVFKAERDSECTGPFCN